MRYLALAALLIAAPVSADLVHTSERMQVRLLHGECALSPVLVGIVEQQKPEWAGKLRGGVLTWEGREIPLCWILNGESIFVIDADGDAGSLPANSFKIEMGT